MVNKCCVPGCRSNYKIKKGERSVTCFTFPIQEQLKEKWLRKIPRHNLKVSKYTVVGIKHFRESDVIKNDVLPGIIRRRRLKGILHSRSDTNRTGAEGLSFYYPGLLHCLDQMLAVMSLSQH